MGSVLQWSTSSFGGGVDKASDVAALGDHFAICRNLTGHGWRMRCTASSVHRYGASRFVTTLALAAALAGIAALLL